MYTLKLLRSLGNKHLSRIIYSAVHVIGLTSLLSVGACNNYEMGSATDISKVGSLNMVIPKSLLIGSENKIRTVFKIHPNQQHVLLADYKLKVSILDQETFTGTTTGSHISHLVSANERKDFYGTFEKLLTEFTSLSELNLSDGQDELIVDFDLLPAQEAIKVKLLFELLDETGKSVQTQEVKWIRNAIAISSPLIFEGEKNLVVLKPSEKDIKDLSTIVVQLKSDEEKVRFYFKSNGKSVATLADLLGSSSKMIIDKPTNPIEIAVDAEDRAYSAKLTIMVFDANAIDESRSLGKKELHWNGIKLNQVANQETFEKEQQNQPIPKQEINRSQQQDEKDDIKIQKAMQEKTGIEQHVQGGQEEPNQPQQVEQSAKETEKEIKNDATNVQEGFSQQQATSNPPQNKEIPSTAVETADDIEIQKEEQVLEQKIEKLQQLEEAVQQEYATQLPISLKVEKKQVKKDVKRFMIKLNKKEKHELKGKTPKERKAIKEKHQRDKEEIKKKLREANENLQHRREHTRGFLNALAHDMLMTRLNLDDSRSQLYREGQLNGHRAAVVLGRTETALGGTLTGVGVATLVAGTGPTLGGAAVGSAALIGVGLGAVAHGIAGAERAQANLAKTKEASSEKSDTSHETTHHVYIEKDTAEKDTPDKINGEKP
ncbi:MAG: cell envelope integrity protein TolA [Candidatus Amoebophilus sp.]